jgi:hypothetical protein
MSLYNHLQPDQQNRAGVRPTRILLKLINSVEYHQDHKKQQWMMMTKIMKAMKVFIPAVHQQSKLNLV